MLGVGVQTLPSIVHRQGRWEKLARMLWCKTIGRAIEYCRNSVPFPPQTNVRKSHNAHIVSMRLQTRDEGLSWSSAPQLHKHCLSPWVTSPDLLPLLYQSLFVTLITQYAQSGSLTKHTEGYFFRSLSDRVSKIETNSVSRNSALSLGPSV